MRLWVLLTAAAILAVAGCAPPPEPGGPRPGPSMHISAPFEPPRAAPAPIGIGLPQMHRVAAAPRCKIKTKTVVNNGVKRVSRYQVCR